MKRVPTPTMEEALRGSVRAKSAEDVEWFNAEVDRHYREADLKMAAARQTNGGRSTSQTVVSSKMQARKVSDMPVPDPPTWLAVGWLPLLSVIVLVGDEGIGKSLLWVWMVANVTTGRAQPVIGLPAREPRDVILVITEDHWAEVRARLELAEADMERIHLVCEEDDGSGSPVFPPDMSAVTEVAERVKPAMIVVDAWLDTVTSGLRVRDPQQAREALHPWREVAAKYGPAILLLAHTNRMSEASTRDRVGATGALRQKARMLLFAAAEPEGQGAQLYVGPDKANGTARNNAVRFDIKVVQVRPRTVDDPGTVAVLARPVSMDKRIGELIEEWREKEREAKRAPTADEKAEKWLREYMNQHGGRALVRDVHAAAQAAGHSPKRVTAVLKEIGGDSKPVDGRGDWYMTLPTSLGSLASLGTRRDTEGAGKTGHESSLASGPYLFTSAETGETGKTEEDR